MRGLNNLKEYKIIFSDIDGTLLNNENQVPEETIEELRRLDSQGVPFVLVSAYAKRNAPHPGRTGDPCSYGVLQRRSGSGSG